MAWDGRFEELLREHLTFLDPGQEIPEDLSMRDFGLDSLGVVDLLVHVELAYGVELEDESLTAETFETPAVLWNAITSLQPLAS